jgi:hypothetical protein
MFDQTEAATSVSPYGKGVSRVATSMRDATSNQSLVASGIRNVTFEQKSPNIAESGRTSMKSRLTSHQSEARSEQSCATSNISLRSTNQSEAAFEHCYGTSSSSRCGSNQRPTTSMTTALTFDLSPGALNQSEARFEQRGVLSARDDANIVSCHVASGGAPLASDHRQLGTVSGDVGSNARDLMADDRDVRRQSCHLSSRRCSHRSTCRVLIMSGREASIVACELSSGRGLVAIDHCLVASMRAHVMSIIDGLTTGWCRVMTMTCDVARGRCHQSSSTHEARSNHCPLTSEL